VDDSRLFSVGGGDRGGGRIKLSVCTHINTASVSNISGSAGEIFGALEPFNYPPFDKLPDDGSNDTAVDTTVLSCALVINENATILGRCEGDCDNDADCDVRLQ